MIAFPCPVDGFITPFSLLAPETYPLTRLTNMATKGEGAGQAFGPVLAAVATMQGNASRTEKTHAHEFLEKFQKSVWPPKLSVPRSV